MRDTAIRACVEAGLEAVLEAGPIALEYFRRTMVIEDKLPGVYYDPVTEADKRIEALIRERLGARFPDHRIVGEEHGDSGTGNTYWIIDPIDGTRSFISGMPTWGILLGLVVEGRPVAGIMHQPFTGETYLADPSAGARFRRNGLETSLRSRADDIVAARGENQRRCADRRGSRREGGRHRSRCRPARAGTAIRRVAGAQFRPTR